MLRELLLEVPARLEARGPDLLAGPLRLGNHNLPGWQCHYRIETPARIDPELLARRFAADGKGELHLPQNARGTLLVTLELIEPYGGARLIGALLMTLSPGTSDDLARQAVYQPLDGRGSAASSGAVLGEMVMLRIPLVAERPERSVPLADLLRRERCLPLSDRGDGNARVMTVHAGESTVLGRCYASQLRERPRKFLAGLGEDTIHWVTLWDDRWVNKLSARLQFGRGDDGPTLLVRNITDYSRANNPLQVESSLRGSFRLPPGGLLELPLEPQCTVGLAVGEGRHRRQLVSCRYNEVLLGGERVPYFKTEKTRFRFPPDSPDRGLEMHYLGIWLPLPVAQFEAVLAQSDDPLEVSFPREAVYCWLRYRHVHGFVAVSSNEDLQRGLTK